MSHGIVRPQWNFFRPQWVNTLRQRQNGRHFTDAIFKCIFLNENVWIPTKISLEFVPQGPINNIPALVQIMTWRRPGNKPLSGPMMVRLPTHICVTRPQWVNSVVSSDAIWRSRTWSTLVEMACCLTALSHYLNQYWFIVRGVSWHLARGISTGKTPDINQ